MNSSNKKLDLQGHRGCRGLLPENSVQSFIEALKYGVTTLEMDAVVSKDKKIVISHDPMFSSVISTKPDGTIVTKTEEKGLLIYEMPYDEVKKFDVGKRGNPSFPEQKKEAAYKPLLKEVVTAVETCLADNKLPDVWYNIETKSIKQFDNIHHPGPEEFIQLLYNELKELGILSRTTIQSFDVRTLQALKKIDDSIVDVLLVYNKKGLKWNLNELGFNPKVYSPDYKLVTQKLIDDCRKLNIKVVPWTINKAKDMEHLINLGVDGLITDYPNIGREVLDRLKL